MYLALYRKYRPTTFEDVLSQPHITTTLKNEVVNNKTAHAYLFTGPRGTGKTTCSKILAMAVNCENPNEGNPCLKCDSCKAIEEGATLDVVEIDAASNNGVDNIRQLREEALYTPAQCRYRVYIIDETHMLSSGAFNALLKIMEEPPEHVKFILATTEAHKVPATILSRCQRFDFHRIKPQDISENLIKIAKAENIKIDSESVDLIARLADGGMRDALSIMDQCIAFSDDITLETVATAAGVAGREYLFKLTDCLVENDAGGAVAIIDELYSHSKDLRGLLEELINHLRNIMLAVTLKSPESVIIALPDEMKRIKEYTSKLPLAGLLYDIDELQACLDKMARRGDQRLALEMCLVKLCTPSMGENLQGVLSRLERLENVIKNGNIPTQASRAGIIQQTESTKTQSTEQSTTEQSTTEQSTTEQSAPIPPVSDNTDTVASQGDEFAVFEDWAEVLAELAKVSMPLCGVLNNSKAFTKGGFLYIAVESAMAGALMRQEGNAAKLIDIVFDKTGVKYKLRMKTAAPSALKEKKEEKKADPLNDLLDKARESGVTVNVEE